MNAAVRDTLCAFQWRVYAIQALKAWAINSARGLLDAGFCPVSKGPSAHTLAYEITESYQLGVAWNELGMIHTPQGSSAFSKIAPSSLSLASGTKGTSCCSTISCIVHGDSTKSRISTHLDGSERFLLCTRECSCFSALEDRFAVGPLHAD